MKFLDKYWFHVFMVTLVLGACIRTAKMTNGVPMHPRADTSEYIGLTISDTLISKNMGEMIREDYPNETAFCFYGITTDTSLVVVKEYADTLENTEWKVAAIEEVTRPTADSLVATPFSISYLGRLCEKDKRLIGIGHTHPITYPFFACGHSSEDALTLQKHGDVLFSLLFCPEANELLWQDGRRIRFYLQDQNPDELDLD